jgi:hypothetical protein
MDGHFAYEFIGFGAMDGYFAYEFIGFGVLWMAILPMNS